MPPIWFFSVLILCASCSLLGLTSQEKSPSGSLQLLRRLQPLRSSTSLVLTEGEGEVNNAPEKKILRVAIVGRPNAGKSTLINQILKLNVCGVSCKTHTTKSPFKSAFVRGDTQVVFVDTPGLVTQKEYSKFNLSSSFVHWKEKVLHNADIIGVVHDASDPRRIFKLHLNLVHNLQEFPPEKPLFLVLNKIDLALDKDALSAAIGACLRPQNLEKPASHKPPALWRKFSRIFFTAALKDIGVKEVANYLVEQAKPGEWLFKAGNMFDKPLHVVVTELLRAEFLNTFPEEVPYLLTYEVEYMKENSLGEIFCVCLVTCPARKYLVMIKSGKHGSLRSLCMKLETDLYNILGKVFKMKVVLKISSQS